MKKIAKYNDYKTISELVVSPEHRKEVEKLLKILHAGDKKRLKKLVKTVFEDKK